MKKNRERLDYCVFAPSESRSYAQRVAQRLGVGLGESEEYQFEDGEMKICPKSSVRSKQVFVIQSLDSEVECDLHRKLSRLLFTIATFKDLGAAKVTAIVPYLSYSRQDRRAGPGDPIANRYQAALLEASGMDSVVTLDVHDIPAFENAYRCEARNLEATPLFVEQVVQDFRSESLVVVSPDAGGLKRAKSFAKALSLKLSKDIPLAAVDKSRLGSDVIVHCLFGDVSDRTVLLYDDMISTGSTVFHAAKVCRESHAKRVVAIATHGLFSGNATEMLSGPEVDQIVVSDTVGNARALSGSMKKDVRVIDTTELISRCILEMRSGSSEGLRLAG